MDWKRKEKWKAVAGVGALAVGAYFTIFSTEKIVSAVGLSKFIGGLFITAPIAALPEVFATWYVARSGQVTSGVTSVIGDHVVTMTLDFIPLTIVCMPIENMQLFSVTLAFVAIMPALYAGFIWWGGRERGFKRWQVFVLPAVYALFVATLVFWVQPFDKAPRAAPAGQQRNRMRDLRRLQVPAPQRTERDWAAVCLGKRQCSWSSRFRGRQSREECTEADLKLSLRLRMARACPIKPARSKSLPPLGSPASA